MDLPLAAATGPSLDRVRQATEEVLRRPEFESEGDSTWFVKGVQDGFTSIGEWATRHPTEAWILVGLLVAVLLGILVHLAYTFYRAVVPHVEESGGATRRSSFEILEGAANDWGSALVKATQALASGDVRRAVWIGHRVLLGVLDERGALKFVSNKTNADYLEECPPQQAAAGLLADLTRVYDQVIYGHRRTDPRQVAQLLQRVGEVRAGA